MTKPKDTLIGEVYVDGIKFRQGVNPEGAPFFSVRDGRIRYDVVRVTYADGSRHWFAFTNRGGHSPVVTINDQPWHLHKGRAPWQVEADPGDAEWPTRLLFGVAYLINHGYDLNTL